MYAHSIPSQHRGPSSSTGQHAFVPARPRVTGDFRKPISSSKWWTGALWAFRTDEFCVDLYPHPLALRPQPSGLGLSLPTTLHSSPDTQMYSYPYEEDLCVGLAGLNSPTLMVADYTDWTATLRWQDNTKRLQAISGHGMPYVFFERLSAQPAQVCFSVEPEIWADEGDTLAVTVRDRHYALFGPAGSQWTRVNARTWVNDLTGRAYWSVAVLPGERADTLADFKRHAHVVVADTQVEWRYDAANSTVHTRFVVETVAREGDETLPLLALYPHQWKYTDAALTDHRYSSPRGVMKVICASEFSTVLHFPGLLPFLPTPDELDHDQVWRLVDSVGSEHGPPVWPQPLEGGREDDAYWSGKAFGRLSQLVHLADQVGHHTARERFLTVIRDKLGLFFDGGAEPCFYYDKTWHSLIFYPAAEHLLDTSLNDHQYTYGYFLRAVATLLHFDPQWWHRGDNADLVRALIKDVANPDRDDPLFPFLRHFDVYAGHSWGSGAAADRTNGLNAEPSSEAIHFAHAVALVGLELGDDKLRDLGIFLAASEIAGAEQYWLDVDGDVFPYRFPWPVAGIVWGAGAQYGTWWTDRPEETHAISMVPMQAGSLYLARRPDYARRMHTRMHELIGGPTRDWQNVHWMYQALYDPPAALADYERRPGLEPEWGSSDALTYHWLHALAAFGAPDATVRADTPCHHVFSKDGRRTYAAYNPGQESIQVRFSDGAVLNVEPRRLETKTIAIGQADTRSGAAIAAPDVAPPPLCVKDLIKTYRGLGKAEVRAVRGLSLQVRAGQCVALLGANGAGKSTTISCLIGLYPPTSGRVRIAGYDVHRHPRQARRHLGVCLQDETLDTELSVLDQLLLHASYFRIPKSTALERARVLLDRFGMAEKADGPVGALSGGMRRVLQVARALISEPALLILDEPSTGLDPEVRRLLWEVLKQQQQRGLAILLTTHYMDEAQFLSDEVAVMHNGQIHDRGTVADLIARHIPEGEVTETLQPDIVIRRPATLEDVYLRIAGGRLRPQTMEPGHDAY